MNLQQLQSGFMTLYKGADDSDTLAFLNWVHSTSESMLKDVKQGREDGVMNKLREDIKTLLALDAVVPTETVIFPEVGDNADCNAANTVHVDAFLYDDDDVDDLCDERKMSRNYCTKCGSKQVEPLTFVSHSSSVTQLKYMFQYLLPPRSLDGQTVLDIGSRLGAVLYGAALYNGAKNLKVVGVEMNAELCALQSKMIEKNRLGDYAQLEVICSDVTACTHVVQNADVIVMNNIFDFFVPLGVQTSVWQFLRANITRPGTRLLLSPAIESWLEHLTVDFEVSEWLQKVDTDVQLARANLRLFGSETSDDSDLSDIHLYVVI